MRDYAELEARIDAWIAEDQRAQRLYGPHPDRTLAEYTGHGENTGGLQRHSIGELYPLVIEYYPQPGEYGILDSRDGKRYVWRHESYDATAGECRRILDGERK